MTESTSYDRRSVLKVFAAGCTATVCGSPPLSAARIAGLVPFRLRDGKLDRLQFDDRDRLRLEKNAGGYVEQGEFVSAAHNLGQPGKVVVDWVEQWTAPQRYEKHEGNPIFGPRQTGSWDNWTNGVSIVRNPDGKSYKMYYSGRQGAGIGFAEGSLDDPLHWKENAASPVLKPRNNWEGNMLNQPRVVKVTATHWRMYYTGWGVKGPGTSWGMGIADSHDSGVSWQRVGGDRPFMERGDEHSPDGAGACVPMVVRVGNRWMMWYTAGMLHPGKLHIHQCLALSADGLNWTKYSKNPVLTADFEKLGNRVVLSRSYVRFDHGVYRMWYSFAQPRYRIHYAESLDGIQWERSPIAPVLGPSAAPAWDDQKVEYPEIDVVDGVYRLWFCGNGFGSVGYAEGVQETAVTVSFRSGPTPAPDATWTAWQPVTRAAAMPAGQHAQVRVKLSSTNRQLSPALNRIVLRTAERGN